MEGGGIGCFIAVSSGEGTPCPIGWGVPACGLGGPLHQQANIEKNGPTGAGGASFGGSWTQLLTLLH
jgi:hypothetical protein